jgi:tetratricopeptide (TPR) repeat protein
VKTFALTLLAALLCLAPYARARSALIDPDLGAAMAQLDRARGPEVYAALRRVWGTWDRADPTEVEQALVSAQHSGRLSPAERAYAGLLVAYARNRRGDIAAARADVRALGFVEHWLVVGPFDNDGRSGFDTRYGPELDFDKPIVPGRAYSGKQRPVRWRRAPDAFPFGWLDTGALVRPEQKVCVFATTFVRAAKGSRAPRPISLWVGASGAFKLFWNGEKVLEDSAYRGHDADRMAASVTLEPGPNNVTLKLCGDDSAPIVSLRLADARGAPDPELETINSFIASAAAAKLVARLEKGRHTKHAARDAASRVQGPLQLFEKQTSGKHPTAVAMEAFARYLVATDGDDATVHQARDLASRAARLAPTVDRLLLAARLAEGHNERADWVHKAVQLAKKQAPRRPNVKLLLAEAAVARESPNWRDAFPFYEDVLELDPSNVAAVRGRVELYNEAGLRRTALATIEHALALRPRSVNLLNMDASELRALGRTSQAESVESRYSALRFDDRTYLNNMIDLAIARRNKPAAERWVGRLVGVAPDSQWALDVAARAYRSVGEPERAVATYRRALALAPEDAGTMRSLADLEGELGHRSQELALLHEILKVRPQDHSVRQYVDHIQPPKSRQDEAYAWAPARFLKLRFAPAHGELRRTLRDLTVTTVYENGLSSKFRQVVFQPLTQTAAALAREYAFQYQADTQMVQLRGARVFRADGRVDEAIESGEAAADDPMISMYTSTRNFYIRLPRLEPGDVVELRYRVDDITPQNEFANYFGEVNYLQSSEPVDNAEYVLITPKDRRFYFDAQVPGLRQTVGVNGDQRIYDFVANDLAPVAPEPAMPPWPQVLGFVHVSTYKTWQQLGQWYWGLIKDQFDLDDETRQLAHDIVKGKTTEADRVKAVYDWVVKNTRYVALEFGIYGFKPHRSVQTVARGWGDCKDKATVLVSLLKALGIPSTIVIVRSGLKGDFSPKVASFAPFDHAIVYVPSLNLYLDGTAEYAGSSELPKLDLGALALQINQGHAKLVHLPAPDPKKNEIDAHVTATVQPNGQARLDLDYVTRGTSAAQWRLRYHADATRHERINDDIGDEFPGFALAPGDAGVTANDLTDLEQPVHLKIRGTAASFARREGKQLSMAVTPRYRLTPVYASLSTRKLDVRVLAFSTLDDTFTIKLPASYKVVSAPPDVAARTRFGSYSVKVQPSNGQVTVTSHLAVKVTRVTPAEYAAWKAFCMAADRALSPRLVVAP